MAYFTYNAPCATTTTTSTTTTIASYTVYLYVQWGDIPNVGDGTIYWEVNYQPIGSYYFGSTSFCDIATFISVDYGDVFSVYINYTFGSVYFNGAFDSIYSGCPSNSAVYCYYSNSIYSTSYVSTTAYIDGLGDVINC